MAVKKNIILCSDGTGNQDIKARGTNVFKLYEALDLHDPEQPQVAFYDDGVGTSGFPPFKFLGGAIGLGLSRNVRQLYASLCRVYTPGDRIFLFGFSRGAFTVRTLAGLVAGCGIIAPRHYRDDAELKRLVEQAYQAQRAAFRSFAYVRERYQSLAQRSSAKPLRKIHDGLQTLGQRLDQRGRDAASRFAALYSHPELPEELIHFMGVWDTVDAVGLPFPHAADVLNEVFCFKFPDYKLSPRVARACHALAVDDERASFHPLLWDEREEDAQQERIEQVWFAGMHSNVGGGYAKQGMSLVALDWMMSKAAAQGLVLIPDVRKDVSRHAHVHDKQYDSRAGLASIYRYKPRDIAELCAAKGVTPKIHISVLERAALGTDGYAPGLLPADSQFAASPVIDAPPQSARAQTAGQVYLDRRNATQAIQDRAQRWMFTGRSLHYAMLAAVLLALGAWVKSQNGLCAAACSVQRILKEDGSLGLVWSLLANPRSLSLLLLALVFWGLGMLIRARLAALFSARWRPIAASLRQALGLG